MRKLLIFTFALVLSMLLTASPVMAASPSVTINGTPVSFTDDSGYPFLDSANRAQVPLRATMEAFGCIVSWNAKTKTAIVEKDGMKVEVPIGQSYILKNGQQVYNDTVAVIKDNKTYLPIRVVLESFGAEVDWDQNNVIISQNEVVDNTISYKNFTSNFEIKVEHDEVKDQVSMKYIYSTDPEALYHYLHSINIKDFEIYVNKLLTDNYQGAKNAADVVFYVNNISTENVVLIAHKGMDATTKFDSAKIEWMKSDHFDW